MSTTATITVGRETDYERPSAFELFEQHTRRTDDGHLLWISRKQRFTWQDGYASAPVRAAFMMLRGVQPLGRVYVRTCSVPICVAPEHHRVVDEPREPTGALEEQGTHPRAGRRSRLSEELREAIRRDVEAGHKTARVANRHGVSYSTVASMRRRMLGKVRHE